MKQKIFPILFMFLLISVWGCSEADCPEVVIPPPPEPTPTEGTVSITAIWPQGAPVPQKYVAEIGKASAELTGDTNVFPEKFKPNLYRVNLLNKPEGVTFEGYQATIKHAEGYVDPQPQWFYFHTQELTIQENTEHKIVAEMTPVIRQLNISFSFPDGHPGLIEEIEAEISGIAHTVDLMSGAVSGLCDVRVPLYRAENQYAASLNLAGIIPGAGQTLTMNITLPESGRQTITGSLDKILADFNGNKSKSMDVSIDVIGLPLESLTLLVSEWGEGEIRSHIIEPAPADTQLTIVWREEVETITGIEIIDKEGKTYASMVTGGVTVGLYELPSSVGSVHIYQDGRKRDATSSFREYDRENARIVFAGDTYFVRTPADLLRVREDMYGKYIQMNDIDMSGIEWESIGSYWNQTNNNPFEGEYDGGGFNIKNLNFNTDVRVSGLFAYNKGTIRNVNVVSGTIQGEWFVSAVCGYNHGIVANCSNGASVTATVELAGGVVGLNGSTGRVIDCLNRGIITTVGGKTAVCGGVTGENHGYVEGCLNEGIINGADVYVGGICGYNGGTIIDCHNTAPIRTEAGLAGGISGYNSNGLISGCTNSGTVTAESYYAGGITSNSNGLSMVELCVNYRSGSVTAAAGNAGGIVGSFSTGTNIGMVMGCVNYADVSAKERLGGIAGTSEALIVGCANHGNVTIVGDGWETGGLVGQNSMTVASSYNTGEVRGGKNVGGLVGKNYRIGSYLVGCYTLGTVVEGVSNVGSICGETITGTYILHCYYNSETNEQTVGSIPSPETTPVVIYRFWHPQYTQGEWPTENPECGWGQVSGENGPANLYCWANFGNKDSNPIKYPELWWESSLGPAKSFAVHGNHTEIVTSPDPEDIFTRVLDTPTAK